MRAVASAERRQAQAGGAAKQPRPSTAKVNRKRTEEEMKWVAGNEMISRHAALHRPGVDMLHGEPGVAPEGGGTGVGQKYTDRVECAG